MSDVVAVGLFTAGASLVVAAIGAVTTYKVSSRGAGAAIATAQSQNKVEMARIEAENFRLKIQYTEEERRNRQATYHQTLTILERLYGVDPKSDELQDLAKEWRFCHAGVQIFGSKSASAKLDDLQVLLPDLLKDDTNREDWQKRFAAGIHAFISAVREDIDTDD